MLEKIREGSQGIVAKSILGLVILTFALSGVYSYLGGSSQPVAAVVNGVEIPQQELERVYESERSRMEAQMGELFSQLAATDGYLSNFKNNLLDNMIADELTSQAASDLGLRVSDEQIKDAIRNMSEFQIEGLFDNERYLTILRQAGYTPTTFRDYMHEEMTKRQLTLSLALSEFSLDEEAASYNVLQNQKRDIRFVIIEAAKFRESVELTEEEIEAYYQANLSNFDTREKVALNYIELSADGLRDRVSVTDQEIEQYYQYYIANYRQPERRRASHILIEVGEDEQAAQNQAESILSELNEGADFAELATEYSADTFSAENGGDLDWFEKGVMDEAFDEAVFSISEVNGLSEVTRSSFGFHVIKLTGIEPEQTKPLESVSGEIKDLLVQQAASDLFFEYQQTVSALTFEVPDTLLDAAEAINLNVNSTELFDRDSVPDSLNFPVVVEQAFSSELIEDRINSDLIDLGQEHIAVIRVQDYQPARTQTLAEVRVEVENALIAEKSSIAAKNLAYEWLALLENNERISELLTERDLSWQEKLDIDRDENTVNRRIVEQAFKMQSVNDEVKAKQVVETNNGFALLELLAIKPGEEGAPTERETVQQRLASGASQRLLEQLNESLKAAADIKKSA